jgi:colicin import membrane protein
LSPEKRQERHHKRYSLIQSQKEKDLRKQLLKMEEDEAAVRQRIESKSQDRRSKSAKQAADKQALRDERAKQLQRERQKEIKNQQHKQSLQEQRLTEKREADAQRRHEEAMLKSEKISSALRAKSSSELHRQKEIEARIKAADARQEATNKLKV